ncbi:MAG: hypothetical protein ACRDXX_04325 [Stackebrandtia sp.]
MKSVWKYVDLGLALVIGASLVVGGLIGWPLLSGMQENNDRAEIVVSARDGVHSLYSVSVESIDTDLNRASDYLTGEMLEVWNANVENVKQAVVVNSSSQTADVKSAAYEKGTGTKATVLLAVDAVTEYGAPRPDEDGNQVDASEAEPCAEDDKEPEGCIPGPVTNHYRFEAQMVKVDGAWLIARLDVV